jgi:hypothetical protein
MQGRAPWTAGAAASDSAAGYLAAERRCVTTAGGSGVHYRCRQQAAPVTALGIKGSRALPQPLQSKGRRNSDVYRVTVEIDVSVAGQNSTYVFNCVRDGQLTVIQPLGMR